MCEFCLKHGEGKKWYLQARHYSDDLLADARRRRFIEGFFKDPDALKESVRRIDDFEKAPRLVQGLLRRLITRRMKKEHYGQVVPIEDVERIFAFTNSIVRIACICRHTTVGREARFCYGVSLSPDGAGRFGEILRRLDQSFLAGPNTGGVETLTRADALAAFRDHEREGLCHTVWTFRTPFIGGVCNCDRTDCLAMRCTVTHRLPIMFRAEYVAVLDPDACVGCRQCMRVCQFGAISYSAARGKAAIDPRTCYGCGVCRAACAKSAIRLADRSAVPEAAKLW